MQLSDIRYFLEGKDFKLFGAAPELSSRLFYFDIELFPGEYLYYLSILALLWDPELEHVGFLYKGKLIRFEDDSEDIATRQLNFFEFIRTLNERDKPYNLVVEHDDFFFVTGAHYYKQVPMIAIYYYNIDYYDLLRSHDRAFGWFVLVWHHFIECRSEARFRNMSMEDVWREFVIGGDFPFGLS